ncbi:MAG: NADH-quinone oxidoreductase subunit C [Xanthomonadaceae bacterium]|nr:NADH-quinone oxidoreductase subunit C [Xanthomonadaceae bacterium]
MPEPTLTLVERLKTRFDEVQLSIVEARAEVTLEVAPENWLATAKALRDEPEFRFELCMDVCGVDYLSYGQVEWDTSDVSSGGFSRGVEALGPGRFSWAERPQGAAPTRRFAVVAHLLSVSNNERLRIRCFAPDDGLPIVPSLLPIWPGVNWFEREAFDLFGIIFEGHPDLRRILTDYGFVGHPFRKDFPLIGNVEVSYDSERGRVIYQPVSIEPRVGVPRVVRHDSGLQQAAAEAAAAKR